MPRVISAHEWDVIESGVIQRVTALEALLDDIYSREGDIPRAVHQGILPWQLIASSSHYHRAVMGIRPVNGVRIQVAGVDLIRDEHGTFRVLEDNVRVPSGVSYVIANRRAMANVFPEAFATMRIRPVHDYPRMLLSALRASAPDGAHDPTVVVLTPGVYNSAYFEHALLARMMGVELVEGRDLVCTGGQVRMRTTSGDRPVDVIYRRVDDEFLDPVHFRGDSVLGVAGLVSAMRSGRVSLANAVGNGVADDKLVYSYLPDLIRFYLDEDPILPNVDTYRCNEPGALQHVLDNLDSMVVKPVDGSGARASSSGPAPTGRRSTGCAPPCAPTRATGSPSRSSSCRRCPPSSTGGWPRGTSTCGPSRSTTATRSVCCQGDSPESPCRRASSSSTPARGAAPRTPGCSPLEARPSAPRASVRRTAERSSS